MTQALITKFLFGLLLTAGLTTAYLGGKVVTLSNQVAHPVVQEYVPEPPIPEPIAPTDGPHIPPYKPLVIPNNDEYLKELAEKQRDAKRKADEAREKYEKDLKEFNERLEEQAEQREKEAKEQEKLIKQQKLSDCLEDARTKYYANINKLANLGTVDSSMARSAEISYENSKRTCQIIYGN